MHHGGLLQIEGLGQVGPYDALTYAQQGQIDWASGAMRDWVTNWAAQA